MFCTNKEGSVFKIIDVNHFSMKNNTFTYLSQSFIYVQNANVVLFKNAISEIKNGDKNHFGFGFIKNSTLKIGYLQIRNVIYSFDNQLIYGIYSKIELQSSFFYNFESPNSDVNFWFKYTNLTLTNSIFQRYYKGLIYLDKSELKIYNSSFIGENSNKIFETSKHDIFSCLKILNSSLFIFASYFSNNIDIIKESGVLFNNFSIKF